MKTSARSPRANSSFKTLETRETYRMVEEIYDIISKELGRAVTTKRIINKGNALGYCRPFDDDERIADAHPYYKVLSEMTNPKSVHFINNLEEIKCGQALHYRLRTDVYRNPNGHWRKVKGHHLQYGMPQD